jgi:hypothetical protein
MSISTFLPKHVGLSVQSIHGHRSLVSMQNTGLAQATQLFTLCLWLTQRFNWSTNETTKVIGMNTTLYSPNHTGQMGRDANPQRLL